MLFYSTWRPHHTLVQNVHAYIYYMYICFGRPWYRGRASTVTGSSPVMSGFCLWDFSTQTARVRFACLYILHVHVLETVAQRYSVNGPGFESRDDRVLRLGFFHFSTQPARVRICMLIYTTCIRLGDGGTEVERQRSRVRVP